MAKRNNFYKTWHGANLNYCIPNHASKTMYEHKFQPALKRYINKIAKEIGATLVSWTKGFWFESFVFERDGKYVYLHHEPWDREYNDLNDWLVRTMKHAEDWTGGCNNHIRDFNDITTKIDKMFKEI